MAQPRRDARRNCGMPIAAGTARDPGRNFRLLSARRLLGRVGGRLGVHLAELHHRRARWARFTFTRGLPILTAIFYGVSPAVIALILHSCYRLAKLGMEDSLQWAIAAVCFLVTVAVQAEVAVLFVASGLIGVLYYGSIFRRVAAPSATAVVTGVGGIGKVAGFPILGKLLLFFVKAGSLTFGSGFVIVPFLEKGLVQNTGWLNERQFLIAVAIGMISPGPVVITATFVGYLVAGFWGGTVSTIGIFLPSFLFVLLVAPILIRHRASLIYGASSKARMRRRLGRYWAHQSC